MEYSIGISDTSSTPDSEYYTSNGRKKLHKIVLVANIASDGVVTSQVDSNNTSELASSSEW